MKRRMVCLALTGCLCMTAGCAGTILKRGLGEVRQFQTGYLEVEGGAAAWITYEAFEFGEISDAPVKGRVPAALMANLRPLAAEQLAKARLFKRVGGTGPEKALLMTGEVIDFDSGSAGGVRAVGLGEKPFVTVRAAFIDKASGRVLSRVNLRSASDSLGEWMPIVSRGLGKAAENYLKAKGMEKLPEERPPGY